MDSSSYHMYCHVVYVPPPCVPLSGFNVPRKQNFRAQRRQIRELLTELPPAL